MIAETKGFCKTRNSPESWIARNKEIRYTLAILFAVNLLNFYDRVIFGAVAEPIRKEWALTDSEVGWLATAFHSSLCHRRRAAGAVVQGRQSLPVACPWCGGMERAHGGIRIRMELFVAFRGAPRCRSRRGNLRSCM